MWKLCDSPFCSARSGEREVGGPDDPQVLFFTNAEASWWTEQFFPALEKETGVAFPEYGGACEHLASPPGYRPPPPGRRPRPVLERNI